MPRWLRWTPLALATCLVALGAFRFGWQVIHLTETDVINRYAARYIDEAGPDASAADCAALPAEMRGVWITLHCAAPGGAPVIYQITRFGTLWPGSRAMQQGPST